MQIVGPHTLLLLTLLLVVAAAAATTTTTTTVVVVVLMTLFYMARSPQELLDHLVHLRNLALSGY